MKKTLKIATIVGARPQFIKAAAVSRVMAKHGVEEILIHTGQHYDANMSDIFFEEMSIPKPQYHLGIGGCTQGAMTGRMLESIEKILLDVKPDWTLVYGDTNSTIAGALAACKLHIPVAHVEAGLRSFNRRMPEEINRILTDHCAQLLLTPVAGATQQLINEGILPEKIVEVGDVMYDAALYYAEKAPNHSQVINEQRLTPKQFVLATIHRAENTDDPKRLEAILKGLQRIASTGIKVVLPLHPRTQQVLQKQGLWETAQRALLILPPVGYYDMIQLEKYAQVILTDSGGVQKEAFFFQTPCVTLRDQTEWIELLAHGCNRLCPPDEEAILKSYQEALDSRPQWDVQMYGQGDASEKILSALGRITNY